ncbi:MAG: hypothetical protein LVQ96_03035 [Thermoplasmatales archaeon]|nr:hypothetical protein [Thermoplasmatales archaeon]
MREKLVGEMYSKMDDDLKFKNELLRSVEQINNRVLGFQSYIMRRTWGVLFGIVALLILVDSLSFPVITYFISSAYLADITSILIQVTVFVFAIFYWFNLFENSARIVKLREFARANRSYRIGNRTIIWRNGIVALFLLCIFAGLVIDSTNITLRYVISNLIFLLVYLVLDIILIRGLKNTFVKIPFEGYAVFFSYMFLVIFSSVTSIIGMYISVPKMLEEVSYLLLGVVLAILLLSSFSFIYHAPDYLEELNGE